MQVETFLPGEQKPHDKIEAIRDLIVQPQAPWFSVIERTHVENALEGHFEEVSRDCFFIGWIGDEPAGQVYYSTAAGAPEIGLLAYVITAPSQRGKGICSILVEQAIEHFLAAGGVCMHLSTSNPGAHHIYERFGFQIYTGQVMRYLRSNQTWEDFDATYFSDVGTAAIRPGHWGDLARIGMLYVAPHPWFIKDYPERRFDHPAIAQMRCGSTLPSMMVNVTERNGGLWVLENPARRVVGAVTLTRLDERVQGHAPILDFLAAPAYLNQASDLLATAISALEDTDAEIARVCLSSCDVEKAEIVQSVGFKHEARLAGQFLAGNDRYDMDVYFRPLCLRRS